MRALKTVYKLFSLQIGEGILSGVNLPWGDPPWRYFEYQDTGGSPSKELYWGEDEDEDEYTEESSFYVYNDEGQTGERSDYEIADFDDDWELFLSENGAEHGQDDLFGIGPTG